MAEDDLAFSLLLRKISKERGLCLSQYKDTYIRRRLQKRMRYLDIESYEMYSRFLSRHPDEYVPLLDTLTINVTNFFRDSDLYEAFQHRVLPAVLHHKKDRGQSMIRIWSAGCATGQEPYSIAMILREVLGFRIQKFIVSILATDIDPQALETAKKGEYDRGLISHVPEAYIDKYFSDNGTYVAGDLLKSLIKFKRVDLFADIVAQHIDVIFCRNVLIYFSRKQQDELFGQFHKALGNGGFLIIGKTETLSPRWYDKFSAFAARERVFRKA